MFSGQILVYYYNNLQNATVEDKRNVHRLKPVFHAETKEAFQSVIEDALDEVPPGKGYVLVKWSGRLFVCERDVNDLSVPYKRWETNYHPLQSVFD